MFFSNLAFFRYFQTLHPHRLNCFKYKLMLMNSVTVTALSSVNTHLCRSLICVCDVWSLQNDFNVVWDVVETNVPKLVIVNCSKLFDWGKIQNFKLWRIHKEWIVPAPADSVRELCKSVQVYQDVPNYCNLANFAGAVELGSRLFKNPEIQLHVIRAWLTGLCVVCK